MRVTIAQYTGDYREAYYRLAAGGAENYFAQRYSVDWVGRLAARCEAVSVVAGITPDEYVEVLPNGVQSIGVGLSTDFDSSRFQKAIAATSPTHLVLTTPNRLVLKWAHGAALPTLPLLADSFETDGIVKWWRNRGLSRLLNDPDIRWVGNHGIAACLSLKQIGVRAERIVPWDWPHDLSSLKSQPKSGLLAKGPLKIAYVGGVVESKGVGDLIAALANLGEEYSLTLEIAGDGDVELMRDLAARRGVADRISFLGRISNAEAQSLMRRSDIVAVPSRHEYPEGLPLTIYEALRSETPIVASDHPMFAQALTDQVSAAVFPAGDVDALAQAVRTLIENPRLYESLSLNAHQALRRICLPLHWGDVIDAWLTNEPEKVAKVEENKLIRLMETHAQPIPEPADSLTGTARSSSLHDSRATAAGPAS